MHFNQKQKDWIRICKKLGLDVDPTRGKGSHCLIKNPKTGAKFTIQHELYNIVNLKIYKKLLEWGYTEDEINEAM